MNWTTGKTLLCIVGVLAAYVGAATIFQGLDQVLLKAANFVGLESRALSWIGFIVFMTLGVYIFVTNPKTLYNTAMAVILAVGSWLFVTKIYYGKITDGIVRDYGFDPRMVLLIQTMLIIVAAGIIYYIALYIYEQKPNAWKAYALISIFGSMVIALSMWAEPYNFFEHLPKNPDGSAAIDDRGNYKIVSKLWILRDPKTNKIIDHSYSPGVSEPYGRQLVRVTPDEAEDVQKYLRENSKIPLIYSKGENPNPGPTKTWQTVFKESYTGKGYDKMVRTAHFPKDFIKGDKIIVKGQEFKILYSGKWSKHQGKYEVINKYDEDPDYYCVKSPKGLKFTVAIERLL